MLGPRGRELVLEPFPREGPSPVHGSRRAIELAGDLPNRESFEDAHLDDTPELGIDPRETRQKTFDPGQLRRAIGLELEIIRQLDLVDLAVKGTRVMDQKPPHDVSTEPQEGLSIRFVLDGIEGSDLQQLEIELIDQNGGLPRVGSALAPHPARCHPAELGVEGSDQLPGRLLAAGAEVFHELGDPVQFLFLRPFGRIVGHFSDSRRRAVCAILCVSAII